MYALDVSLNFLFSELCYIQQNQGVFLRKGTPFVRVVAAVMPLDEQDGGGAGKYGWAIRTFDCPGLL
jgi:hypothetical protein